MSKPIIELYIDIITTCEKEIDRLNREIEITKNTLESTRKLLIEQSKKEK